MECFYTGYYVNITTVMGMTVNMTTFIISLRSFKIASFLHLMLD